MDVYTGLLLFLSVPVIFLVWKQGIGTSGGSELTSAFKKFRNLYLFVFSLEMVGDWLQGPYVYALYEMYGFSPKQIGQLFIAGFGASMIVGTVVGSMADKHGRKLACLAYVALYSLSCATKHSPNFWVLMVGRILGGTATSLLFSAFESWLVGEHFRRGFPESMLGDTFSWQVFLGNGVMAVFSGMLGTFLVERLDLGRVAPFDAAILFMIVGGVVIYVWWPENYGDTSTREGVSAQLVKAWGAIVEDKKLALLGAMQGMFEASMYTFVFLWTPALSPNKEKISHGMIFSCFMTASMVGSLGAGLLMKSYKVEKYMQWVFGAAAAALFVPFWCHLDTHPGAVVTGSGLSSEGRLQLFGFCAFEVCVGVFWPSMMKMRAHYVPEELRATIINMFRIPLNLFVCIVLFNVEYFSLSFMFGLCVTLLILSMICQVRLEHMSAAEEAHAHLLDDSEMPKETR